MFGALCGFLLNSLPAYGQRNPVLGIKPLSLDGRVLKLEKLMEDASLIGFEAKLLLTFKNVGDKPIIIYNHKLWLGAVSLSCTVDDVYSYKFLLNDSAWPSVRGKKDRIELYNSLDQPTPPSNLTLILRPGLSWEYETVAILSIYKNGRPDGSGKSWDEIKKNSPLWLQVTLEMWPVNAEPKMNPNSPEFGLELRNRWKNFGNLWLDYLLSQPIKIDFGNLRS